MVRATAAAALAALLLGLSVGVKGQYDYGGGAATMPDYTGGATSMPAESTTTGGEATSGGAVESSPSGGGGQTFMIDPWEPPAQGQNFGEHDAKVGDSVTFKWTGTHGVYSIPDGNCPDTFVDQPPLREVSAPTDGGTVTENFDSAGTRWYACPVDGHCKLGMLVKFTIT